MKQSLRLYFEDGILKLNSVENCHTRLVRIFIFFSVENAARELREISISNHPVKLIT